MEGPTPTVIVRVHRPELTAQERARRMEVIKHAATKLVQATLIHRKREDKTE
jgi:hypothetical protein